MSQENLTSRRTFARQTVSWAIAALGVESFLSACGTSVTATATPAPTTTPTAAPTTTPTESPTTTAAGGCAADGTSVAIQVQHSPNHTLTISGADVTAGVAKTYTLADNGSGHTHQVTLSAQDFVNLQNGQGIQETSTITGHTHVVTVNCA